MMSYQNRLKILAGHLTPALTSGVQTHSQNMIGDSDKKYVEVIDFKPNTKTKLDYINKQGWGYNDTHFTLEKNGKVKLVGNRYVMSEKWMPNMKKWTEEFAGIDYSKKAEKQKDMEIHAPHFNHAFLEELGEKNAFQRRSFLKWERIMHSHGATLQEVFILRHGAFERCVDVVIYPDCTEQVERLVSLANKHNVVLIPYGGGTNVTQSLMLRPEEKRMIVSVDMARMNKIKWIDKVNMIACIEAGIIGSDLERELRNYGVCLGHEPDSVEFSTLGGWISTRASGMKKNYYGNIEDIVQNVRLVTSKGTYNKLSEWPRVSNGMDLNHMVMGSEGNLGIITEAVLRIRKIPEVKKYGSIIFPDFEVGIKFMEEVARTRYWPASIRLVDNTQFQFGQAMKTEAESTAQEIIDKIKKFYVLNVKGFDVNKMCAVTIAFEGFKSEVKAQEDSVYSIAKKYGGMNGGEENGIRGYFLTFTIAYIRDFAAQYSFVAESFETSCPWSKVSTLCQSVKERLYQACKKRGIPDKRVFGSFRVTQLYETGAAVYVYFGFNYVGIPYEKVVHIYEEVENECRDEILKQGGSLSHHHGIGKIRKRFMKQILPPMAFDLMDDVKKSLDPNNVFAINNTIYRSAEEEKKDLGEGHH